MVPEGAARADALNHLTLCRIILNPRFREDDTTNEQYWIPAFAVVGAWHQRDRDEKNRRKAVLLGSLSVYYRGVQSKIYSCGI